MREEGSGTRSIVDRVAAGRPSFDHLNRLLTLGNSEAIALAVQEGIGVAFVTQSVVDYLVSGRVVPVKVNGLQMQQDIYIGRSHRHPATVAQTAFWNFVNDARNPVL
jgi:DNA-binding transcriptional LysR family regulator